MRYLIVTLAPPARPLLEGADAPSPDRVLEDVRAWVEDLTGCATTGRWDGEKIVLRCAVATVADESRARGLLAATGGG